MQEAPQSLLRVCPSLACTSASVTDIIVTPMLSPSGFPLQRASRLWDSTMITQLAKYCFVVLIQNGLLPDLRVLTTLPHYIPNSRASEVR